MEERLTVEVVQEEGDLVPQSLLCLPLMRRANVGRREVAVIGAEAEALQITRKGSFVYPVTDESSAYGQRCLVTIG